MQFSEHLLWMAQERSPEEKSVFGFRESHLERAKKVKRGERSGCLWTNSGPWPRTRLLPHSPGGDGTTLEVKGRSGIMKQLFWGWWYEARSWHTSSYSGTRSQVTSGNLPWRMLPSCKWTWKFWRLWKLRWLEAFNKSHLEKLQEVPGLLAGVLVYMALLEV